MVNILSRPRLDSREEEARRRVVVIIYYPKSSISDKLSPIIVDRSAYESSARRRSGRSLSLIVSKF